MLFGEILNTIEKLREPSYNSSTVYAKIALDHSRKRDEVGLWCSSYTESSSLCCLGFFGSVFALCHEYSKLSPDLEKLQGVKGIIKLSSKFSKILYQEIFFAAYRGLYTLQQKRKKLFHRKAEL